jgi:hypothetical protein
LLQVLYFISKLGDFAGQVSITKSAEKHDKKPINTLQKKEEIISSSKSL